MRLRSLELSGFKSFAKKTTLQFSAPIVAIVGPNGSGKSNVAEAFRFVLGEQSLKSLRGRRGEDLIFNGSRNTPRANRASVKLTFENADRTFPIDFDQVIFERIVHRDATNEYLLNGSTVRLKDSVELLASVHLGASGHHIIAQGQADRILSATSAERRAMVEDALGLKVFQYKKEESEKKLLKTEENIRSVRSVRKEIEPHIRFLKKQAAKIEHARQMRDELLALYKDYFARERLYLHECVRQLKEAQREPEQEYALAEKELREARQALSRASGASLDATTHAGYEEHLRILQERRETLTRALGRLEGALGALESAQTLGVHPEESPVGKTVPVREVAKIVEEVSKTLERGIAQAAESGLSRLTETMQLVRERLHAFVRSCWEMNVFLREESTGHPLREGERTRLAAEKAAHECEIAALKEEEKTVKEEYARVRQKDEQTKNEERDAQKMVFASLVRREKAHGELAALKNRVAIVAKEEEDFKRELGEAAALVGRAVVRYVDGETLGAGEGPLREEVMSEERLVQEGRHRALERLKIRVEESGVADAGDILKEYEEAQEREGFLEREIADLEQSARSLSSLIAALNTELDGRFKGGIAHINAQFQEFFTLMFGGGKASLLVERRETRRRVSSSDLFSFEENGSFGRDESMAEEEGGKEGIVIEATLPYKRVKGLEALSGGERALTSIALLFAISQVNPPPFIVLDETDAALDEANAKRYADMVELLSKHSQLIVITHNRETMSRAGILYGVTMGADALSQLLSVRFDDAVATAH